MGSATTLAALPAYLAFVGNAVPSPLARPLRAWPVQVLLLAAIAVVLSLLALAPNAVFTRWRDVELGQKIAWGVTDTLVYPVAAPLVALFALAAAVHAWARAERGTVARRRAGAYALAFGAHDLSIAITAYAYVIRNPVGELNAYAVLFAYVGPGLALASFVLLAFALLRYQLFDFELKLKWTLRRGTLAGVFLAFFVVVAQVAGNYLEGLGWLAGGVATGLLLLALRPIERAVDRAVGRAMPGVEPTPEYVAYKKLEVYRAAVESALESGGIDAKERATLDGLRRRLGVAEPDAAAVERDAGAAA